MDTYNTLTHWNYHFLSCLFFNPTLGIPWICNLSHIVNMVVFILALTRCGCSAGNLIQLFLISLISSEVWSKLPSLLPPQVLGSGLIASQELLRESSPSPYPDSSYLRCVLSLGTIILYDFRSPSPWDFCRITLASQRVHLEHNLANKLGWLEIPIWGTGSGFLRINDPKRVQV
jgi:hypothetical protein